MPLDQALKDLMVTSGSYQNVASRDVYAKRVGGTAVPFKCHITLNREDRYAQEDSGTAVYAGVFQMDGVYNIQKGAIITIEGQAVKAVKVTTYFDEFGANHTSVEFSGQ